MAFEAEWFWKMFRPGKNESGLKQHEQEQKPAKPPLTPEEAYRKREARRKRKAQKGARRRNRR